MWDVFSSTMVGEAHVDFTSDSKCIRKKGQSSIIRMKLRKKRKYLLEDTNVLTTVMDRKILSITERVIIKEKQRNLNSKTEDSDRFIEISFR